MSAYVPGRAVLRVLAYVGKTYLHYLGASEPGESQERWSHHLAAANDLRKLVADDALNQEVAKHRAKREKRRNARGKR